MPFPLSYFENIYLPKKIFAFRKELSWWKIIFIFIFLNALVLIPSTIDYATLENYDYELFVKDGLKSIDQDTIYAVKEGKLVRNQYVGEPVTVEKDNHFVAVLPDEKSEEDYLMSKKDGLVVTKERWILHYKTGENIMMSIKGDGILLSQYNTVDKLKTFINSQWFASNQFSVVVMLIMVSALIIYVGSILLIFVGGLLVSLTKKAKIFDIASYKESVSLLVNCYGLPTLLALLVSLKVDSPITIMNIQVFGTILMMTLVFYKTHFQDEIE